MAAKSVKEPVKPWEAEKEFQKIFQKLCTTRQSWEVWSDMVNMFARSYSNFYELAVIANPEDRSERWKKREAEYLQLINKYTKDEQKLFPELHSLMVMELERRRGDFLGDMYMKLNLGSHWHGQFFTPQSVATLMAKVTIEDKRMQEEIERKGFITVTDPACGAGVNLLAGVDVLMQSNINFQTKALFAGQDIDSVAGLMCYIQLSAFGCAGYVCIADTLANPMTGHDPLLPVERPDQEWWYTPTWYSPLWQGRQMAHKMDLMLRPKKQNRGFIFDFKKGTVEYGRNVT